MTYSRNPPPAHSPEENLPNSNEKLAQVKVIIAEYDIGKGWFKKSLWGRGSRTWVLDRIDLFAQQADLAQIQEIVKNATKDLLAYGIKRIWDLSFSQTQIALIKLDFLLNDGTNVEYFWRNNSSFQNPSDVPLITHLAKVNIVSEIARFYDINRFENINIKDFCFAKNTALHWAIMNNSCDSAIALLQHEEIDLAIVDRSGKNALHMSILKGREHTGSLEDKLIRLIGTGLKATINDVVKVLLDHPKILNIINLTMSDGNTPLHLACMRKDHALRKKLIVLGANPDAKNKAGKKPEDMLDMYIDAVRTYMNDHTSNTATVSRTIPTL